MIGAFPEGFVFRMVRLEHLGKKSLLSLTDRCPHAVQRRGDGTIGWLTESQEMKRMRRVWTGERHRVLCAKQPSNNTEPLLGAYIDSGHDDVLLIDVLLCFSSQCGSGSETFSAWALKQGLRGDVPHHSIPFACVG